MPSSSVFFFGVCVFVVITKYSTKDDGGGRFL